MRASPSRKQAIALGDHVRLPASASNEHVHYGPEPGAGRPARQVVGRRGFEPVQGIVTSIREIATGRLIGLATGDLRQYVLELVVDECFDRSYSSETNCEGPKGPDRITDNSIWRHLRGELRQRAERREFQPYAPIALPGAPAGGGIAQSLSSILDGWRIIKVRAPTLESLGEAGD
jgi:hypothetical protein